MGVLCAGCESAADDGGGAGGGEERLRAPGRLGPTVVLANHPSSQSDLIIITSVAMKCESSPVEAFHSAIDCPSFKIEVRAPQGRIVAGAVIGDDEDELVMLQEYGTMRDPEATACPTSDDWLGPITIDALTADSITVTLPEVELLEGKSIGGSFTGSWCGGGGGGGGGGASQ